jgi:hypothetical protein
MFKCQLNLAGECEQLLGKCAALLSPATNRLRLKLISAVFTLKVLQLKVCRWICCMKSCFWPGSLLQSAIEVRTPIAKCCGGDSPLAGKYSGRSRNQGARRLRRFDARSSTGCEKKRGLGEI